MPRHPRTNRNNYKVWENETEYLKWFNTFWCNETKRISKQVNEKRRGRKPKGFYSLKIEHKEIILSFD